MGEQIAMINHYANEVFEYGGEGIMLQDNDMPYITGRSKCLIKVKRRDDFVGTIVDIELADPSTKIAGGARAVRCRVDECDQEVRVGSGFTNEERNFIAKNRIGLIGEKIEIEAFGLSKNRFGETSLSMPVFKQFVNHKITESINHIF